MLKDQLQLALGSQLHHMFKLQSNGDIWMVLLLWWSNHLLRLMQFFFVLTHNDQKMMKRQQWFILLASQQLPKQWMKWLQQWLWRWVQSMLDFLLSHGDWTYNFCILKLYYQRLEVVYRNIHHEVWLLIYVDICLFMYLLQINLHW